MLSPEIIAEDILTQRPLNPLVAGVLIIEHGVDSDYLGAYVDTQRQHISAQMGEIALALRRGESEGAEMDVLVADEEMVWKFLRQLGPTNSFTDNQGFDAGIDLGRITHLLESDFNALPENKKGRTRHRHLEGLVREELALLWKPSTPQRFEGRKGQAFMYDLEDPNVFTPEQVTGLSEETRWKLIGAKLADEAADVFQEVQQDRRAPLSTKLDALCRMTDMRIRSLWIQMDIANDEAERTRLYQQMDTLNADYLTTLAEVSEQPQPWKIKPGKLFGLIAVGVLRARLFDAGITNRQIRSSTAHEDRLDPSVEEIHGPKGQQIKLFTDVVIENQRGNFIEGLQVKCMTPEHFEESQRLREQRGLARKTFMPGLVRSLFIDDFPEVSSDFGWTESTDQSDATGIRPQDL